MSGLGAGALALGFALSFLRFTGRFTADRGALILLLLALALVLYVFACFRVKAAMEDYYSNTEPIGLYMAGLMIWVFGSVYIQYHLCRIAKWKETGILKPQ